MLWYLLGERQIYIFRDQPASELNKHPSVIQQKDIAIHASAHISS